MRTSFSSNGTQTIALREIILLAVDSFRLNQVRFALTALGMVIGTASLILVVTIGSPAGDTCSPRSRTSAPT